MTNDLRKYLDIINESNERLDEKGGFIDQIMAKAKGKVDKKKIYGALVDKWLPYAERAGLEINNADHIEYYLKNVGFDDAMIDEITAFDDPKTNFKAIFKQATTIVGREMGPGGLAASGKAKKGKKGKKGAGGKVSASGDEYDSIIIAFKRNPFQGNERELRKEAQIAKRNPRSLRDKPLALVGFHFMQNSGKV